MWIQKVNQVLLEQGYTCSKADPGLYSKKDKNGDWTYVLVYVDDLLVCGKDTRLISKLLSELNKHFETKDLGNASYYLEIQIE